MSEILISTLKHTITITVFVLLMMVVIEYINVQSKNKWAEKFQHNPFLQIFVAALLGITPGCLGAFTVVSLYTHRMMGLAALVSVMIATSGDEAFVMFAMFPGKAIMINLSLLAIAIVAGWIVHLFTRNQIPTAPRGFIIHEKEHCYCFVKNQILPQLKNITFERALFIMITSLFILALLTGSVGPVEWGLKRVTILIGTLVMLFVIITVPEHFLKKHLYDHILKKHLLKIFFWTWGALLILHFIEAQNLSEALISNNLYMILIISVLVGIIPESGPHLVFVTMFSQSLIPFSILLANSIVQDGHGMLPLLAESRKDFLKIKIINIAIGFLVGIILMQFGI